METSKGLNGIASRDEPAKGYLLIYDSKKIRNRANPDSFQDNNKRKHISSIDICVYRVINETAGFGISVLQQLP